MPDPSPAPPAPAAPAASRTGAAPPGGAVPPQVSVFVRPWPDPVIDVLGFDPRSFYVERFWLPTLGPTSLLLLRHLADRFDRSPEPLALPLVDTAAALGLGKRGGSSPPLLRTLARLEQFDLARDDGRGVIAVRRALPPVSVRHVRRLPLPLQVEHAEWAESQLARPPHDAAGRRARRLALALLGQGDDADQVERALRGVGFHPALCHDAVAWARRHHADALAAGEAPPTPSAGDASGSR